MTVLPGWIADPVLRSAWDLIRTRFEQAGLNVRGKVLVRPATRDERHAIGALLGRTITSDAVRVDLAALDTRLNERSGVGGLEAVLAALYGTPPEDRPAVRAARDESRERPLQLAAELVTAPWSSQWIAGLRRTGLLTNRGDSEQTIREAATVLGELTDTEGAPLAQSRVELGARLLGDAHALDRDRLYTRSLCVVWQLLRVSLSRTGPANERTCGQNMALSRTCSHGPVSSGGFASALVNPPRAD